MVDGSATPSGTRARGPAAPGSPETVPASTVSPARVVPSTVPRVPLPLGLGHYDRRVLTAQIALRLAPVAWAWGGFASAELCVAVARQAPRRPDVAVVLGAPPRLPPLEVPPLLVVELAPGGDAQAWLDLGVAEVWHIGGDGAAVVTAGTSARWVDSPGVLSMPPPERPDQPALELALPVVSR